MGDVRCVGDVDGKWDCGRCHRLEREGDIADWRERRFIVAGERRETSPVPIGLPAVVNEVGERRRLRTMGREAKERET